MQILARMFKSKVLLDGNEKQDIAENEQQETEKLLTEEENMELDKNGQENLESVEVKTAGESLQQIVTVEPAAETEENCQGSDSGSQMNEGANVSSEVVSQQPVPSSGEGLGVIPEDERGS